MLALMHFHHIGYAVKDIKTTSAFYQDAGWTMSPIQFDIIQGTDIAFLKKDGEPLIELVSSHKETSPVSKAIAKMGGVTVYHVCYIVEALDEAIMQLRKKRFVLLFNPVPAVAMDNKRICYMMHPDVGLIELVEA